MRRQFVSPGLCVITAIVLVVATSCGIDIGSSADPVPESTTSTARTSPEGGGLGGAGGAPASADDSSVDASAPVYAISFEASSGLWVIEPEGDRLIGKVRLENGSPIQLTDVAQDSQGNLFAISFDELFMISSETATAKRVGGLGVERANAATFSDDGTLYIATIPGGLYTVDTVTGSSTPVGKYGLGLGSSGDLAFFEGRLLATAKSPDGLVEELLDVDIDSGAVEVLPSNLPLDVFGLYVAEGTLFGTVFTDSGKCRFGALIEIDGVTGNSSQVRCLEFAAGGA